MNNAYRISMSITTAASVIFVLYTGVILFATPAAADENRSLNAQQDKVSTLLNIIENPEDSADLRLAVLDYFSTADVAMDRISPVLLGVLKDVEDTEEVPVAIVRFLQRKEQEEILEEALPALGEALAQPEDRDVTITLLNEIGSDKAKALLSGLVDDLVQELGDEDPGVRLRAVQQLAEVGPAAEQAMPEIKEKLNDESDDVVEAAIIALRDIDITAFDEIIKVIEVAPVWSVHLLGAPNLVTSDDYQYIAYYDKDAYLTLAQREIGSTDWEYVKFPVQMGWASGGHACLTLALDRDGYVHLSSYRRSLRQGPPSPPAKIYYRSMEPHDISDMERRYMVSEDESPDYPTFTRGADDELFFHYRAGVSGRGDHIYNVYDPDSRSWKRLHDGPFFDGQGRMNAYGVPRLGPDGNWHVVWVWRNTGCNSTNHSLSYARSEDMQEWETADGEPVELPFTSETEGVIIDPETGTGSGITNQVVGMSWDSQNRPVINYHKFDEDGNSQMYNARFEDGEWNIVQATDWDFTWNYGGAGRLRRVVTFGGVSVVDDNRLEQNVFSERYGDKVIILNEETLEPVGQREPDETPAWRRALLEPESDFQVKPNNALDRLGGPMEVSIGGDRSGPAAPFLDTSDPGIPNGNELEEDNLRYIWRWEHAGGNRDRPVPRPWPEPTMLRVYLISD